jgi:hypothetical protein
VTLVSVAMVSGLAGGANGQTTQGQTTQGQTRPRDTQMPQGAATTTVSAPSATVHARCDESSPLRITLGRGEKVVIRSIQDNWVNVIVPATGEEGCMRRALLERVPAMDQADESRRARQAASAPGAKRPAAVGLDRAMISVNAGWQSASHTFSEAQSFPLYQETARFTSSYEVKSNLSIDAGGAVRLWKQLGVGVAVTSFKDERDITIEGTLPHPFFFQRDRPISGTTNGEREELAVHVNAAYFIPVNRKLQLVAFGGPSFFTVKQTLVSSINYAETFPYDTTSFTSAVTRKDKESKVGFNVGVDVAWYFSKYVGAGGIFRFSAVSVPFSPGDLDAGGAEVGGGLRIRIP